MNIVYQIFDCFSSYQNGLDKNSGQRGYISYVV